MCLLGERSQQAVWQRGVVDDKQLGAVAARLGACVNERIDQAGEFRGPVTRQQAMEIAFNQFNYQQTKALSAVASHE